LPPEKERDAILSETLRAYASYDRLGALDWLRAQPPAPTLDAGAARLAYEFATRNPDVALEMIGRIQEPDLFAKTHKMLTFQWKGIALDMHETLMKRLDAVPAPGATATKAP